MNEFPLEIFRSIEACSIYPPLEMKKKSETKERESKTRAGTSHESSDEWVLQSYGYEWLCLPISCVGISVIQA